MKFAVVGGGIAGLAAAWELVGPDAPGPDVTVFEAGQLGGKLRTTSFLGQPVDEAPDSLITRVPEGVALCEELGLSDSLVAPAATRAVLFAQGKLRPLPGGLVLGARHGSCLSCGPGSSRPPGWPGRRSTRCCRGQHWAPMPACSASYPLALGVRWPTGSSSPFLARSTPAPPNN